MRTPAQLLVLVAALASFSMLLAAWGFQYLGDMAPCKLCIWQRWPHGAAAASGVLALMTGWKLWGVTGFLGASASGAIGVYHTGVERNWWEGPTSCTSGDVTTLSTDDLLAQIMEAPLVRCDEVPWELFTLSMASWNAVASFGFAVLWVIALRRWS